MGWFSDKLFGKRKRINEKKLNAYMRPYNKMIDEQENIAREMMDPFSARNMQKQEMMRSNQMDMIGSQNQSLMKAAAMNNMSPAQAMMQQRMNTSTATGGMAQQAMQMQEGSYNQGLGLLGGVMGMRQGEGERLSNMHIQKVNAHNARRQANMNMTTGWIQQGAEVAAAAMSDKRLKTNIELVGKSDKGHNIYEFDYINKPGRYRGVMAQEVPNASFKHNDGYLWVDYNKVDVKFERIN